LSNTNPCAHCGKAVPSKIPFKPNTGSVAYLSRILRNSGVYCRSCREWFCGACSDKSAGKLGSKNFRNGYLYLSCPTCGRKDRTKLLMKSKDRPGDPLSQIISDVAETRVHNWLVIGILAFLLSIVPFFALVVWLGSR